MKDRLAELHEIQKETEEEESIDIDSHKSNPLLETFFTQINDIQQAIYQIQQNVQEIKKRHSILLSSPAADEKVQKELEWLMAEVKKHADNVKISLKNMDKSIKEEEKQSNKHCADIRIKKIQHSILSKEFLETMTEYNTVQNANSDRSKERLKRQLHIAGKTVENDELEVMLENDNLAVFTQNIITDTQQAKQSLREIEARHSEILKLEKSIKELAETFTEMANIIREQGDLIDRIEYNVDQSEEYVHNALTNTKKALQYQGKARRKKIILAVIIAIVLISIIVGIVCALLKNEK